MRDNLALAHIQTELWKAYVMTRQRTDVPASTGPRVAVRPLRFLKSVRRRRRAGADASSPE